MALTPCAASSAEHNCTRWAHALSTLHECACGHSWHQDAASRQGAPRLALDGNADERPREAGDRVEKLGAAVSVRQLVPASAGHAVRLVVDGPLWLDPADAHLIADALNAAALEAIHADRAVRHG